MIQCPISSSVRPFLKRQEVLKDPFPRSLSPSRTTTGGRCLTLISLASFLIFLLASFGFGQSFERIHLDFDGRASRILTHSLTPDSPSSIFVLHRKRRVDHHFLTIFRPGNDHSYSSDSARTIPLSENVSAVGLGDYNSSPDLEIVLLTSDTISLIEQTRNDTFQNSRKRSISSPSSLFQFPDERYPRYWPYTHDLNGNGRDDLILPSRNGYQIYYQTPKHTLKPKTKLSFNQHRSVDHVPNSSALFQYRSQRPNLLVQDFNGDETTDLITTFKNRVAFYLQDPDQGFPARPTGVFPLKYLVEEPEKNQVQFTKTRVQDVNQDGKPEIIISRISGEFGVFDSIKTTLYIYKGRGTKPHPWTPDQIIRIPGVSIPPRFHDANGDGYRDLLITSLRTDLMSKAWEQFTGNLSSHHFLYLFDPNSGLFGKKSHGEGPPDFSRKLSVNEEMMEEGIAYQPFLSFDGDFNGDGTPDMLHINENLELRLHLAPANDSGDRLLSFHDEPFYKSSIGEFEKLHVQDLNQDQKSDILVEYDSQLELFLSQ